MKFREFGTACPETIVLLHGGGLSWWNYRAASEALQSDFHVILPVLDGHAGSDRPFTTIEDNAEEIISFIDEQCGGHVLLIGGLSLGAQVALEILSRRHDICRFALIESAAVLPSKLTNALIGPALGSTYGLTKNRRFARAQFRSLHMDETLFEDYFRDTAQIAKSDMIAFLRANTSYALKDSFSGTSAAVHVVAGGKENREILKSAGEIKRRLSACRVEILPGLYHGEFSLNLPDRYARYIRSMTAPQRGTE